MRSRKSAWQQPLPCLHPSRRRANSGSDGRTVSLLSGSHLSDIYHDEILGSATPFVPADITDQADRQARVDAFNATKADALVLWEKNKAASLIEGPAVQYRPSTAMPRNWWDRTTDVWTHQSFQVQGTAGVVFLPPQPADWLLRMKVDDNVLRPILQASTLETHVPLPLPEQPVIKLSSATRMKVQPVFADILTADSGRTQPLSMAPAPGRVKNILATDTINTQFVNMTPTTPVMGMLVNRPPSSVL